MSNADIDRVMRARYAAIWKDTGIVDENEAIRIYESPGQRFLVHRGQVFTFHEPIGKETVRCGR